MENLLGFLLPPVIHWVNQKVANQTARFAISIVISAVLAIVLKFNELKYTSPEEVLESIALIFTESQIAYRMYWEKNSPVQKMVN